MKVWVVSYVEENIYGKEYPRVSGVYFSKEGAEEAKNRLYETLGIIEVNIEEFFVEE